MSTLECLSILCVVTNGRTFNMRPVLMATKRANRVLRRQVIRLRLFNVHWQQETCWRTHTVEGGLAMRLIAVQVHTCWQAVVVFMHASAQLRHRMTYHTEDSKSFLPCTPVAVPHLCCPCLLGKLTIRHVCQWLSLCLCIRHLQVGPQNLLTNFLMQGSTPTDSYQTTKVQL